MSNNNSETNGLVIGVAFIAVAAMFMAIIVYIILGVITFGLSIFCLFTLGKPRKFFNETITPSEARWFIGRGVIGLCAFPLLVGVVASMADIVIDPDWIIHIMVSGYIIGALGGEYVRAKIEEAQAQNAAAPNVLPAPDSAARPIHKMIDVDARQITFASWDDEEDDR